MSAALSFSLTEFLPLMELEAQLCLSEWQYLCTSYKRELDQVEVASVSRTAMGLSFQRLAHHLVHTPYAFWIVMVIGYDHIPDSEIRRALDTLLE